MPVSRSEIVAAYRAILGRDPENEKAVEAHLTAPSLEVLLGRFLSCDELAKRRKPAAQPLNWQPIEVEAEVAPKQLRRMHERVGATWTKLGQDEPYWSVLTNPDFESRSLAGNRSRFYESGRHSMQLFEAFANRSGLELRPEQTCFELGCGVGRITAWLSPRFSRVIAADISASHLVIAKEALAERGIINVELLHLQKPEALQQIPHFDIFISLIVLQHNPPPIMAFILKAVLGALNPGGIAFFQLPTYREGYSFHVDEYLSRRGQLAQMEMHVLPQNRVFEIMRAADCRVLEVREDGWTGIGNGISNTFLARKDGFGVTPGRCTPGDDLGPRDAG